MPNSVVKTKQDEKDWATAKRHCDEDDWECVMGVFKKIKANRKKSRK